MRMIFKIIVQRFLVLHLPTRRYFSSEYQLNSADFGRQRTNLHTRAE